MKLRQDYRIAGSLAGSLPRSPMQNIFARATTPSASGRDICWSHHDIIDLVVDNQNHGLQQHYDSDPDASNTTIFGLTDHALVYEQLEGPAVFHRARNEVWRRRLALPQRPTGLPCKSGSLCQGTRGTTVLGGYGEQCAVGSPCRSSICFALLFEHMNATITPSTAATTIPPLSDSNRRVVAFAVEWAGFEKLSTPSPLHQHYHHHHPNKTTHLERKEERIVLHLRFYL